MELPPGEVVVGSAAVIAPRHGGAAALPGQGRDIEAVRRVVPLPTLAQRFEEVRTLLEGPSVGLLHFAGHGQTVPGSPAVHSIALEDGNLDATTWSGLVRDRSGGALVFFNACEVGEVESGSGVVEGWAPEVLRAGAAGYIAPMWAVSDQGAAAFAEVFYGRVGEGVDGNRGASVLDALTTARQAWVSTGDPAALAYVYYGSPSARLVRPRN